MLGIIEVLYILFLINLLVYCNAKDHCSSEICNASKEHTLCKFQSEDPARHCVDYEQTIRTAKEKQAILDKLNSRRNKVAGGEIRSLPSADSMMKLEWNKELELTAQRWANQCVKHSVPDIKDTCRDLDGVYVGQNIATIYGDSPGLAPLSLVDVWYMELLNVNSTILPHYKPSTESGFSHYDYFTQLMWAKSFQVGCGGVKFRERMPDTSGAVKRMIYRLVCNFAPGGNRLNHSVYTEGAPCEQCPSDTTCDSIYKSLCSSKKFKTHTVLPETTEPFTNAQSRTRRKKHRTTSAKSKTTMESEFLEASTRVLQTGDDHYTPFDYFSHIHEYVSSSITITTTKKVSSCKDIMAVDDFVELLKKKLSTDPMFKEILFTTKYSPLGNSDNPYDASVAALVSKIYSKKTYPTTTKMPDSEYVNSTLLVDLVEAVIFRSGDKIRSTEVYKSTYPILDVSPVKIQAELAEVRPNSDFTGHYFFPEEEVREDEFSSEMTESYYDAQSPPISDVVLEIEDLKRSKATKDFLDDILESESIAESTTKIVSLSPDHINLYKKGRTSLKKFLQEIEKNKSKPIT
ncbi:uncharacterized protein LOC113231623 isoform X2 [Hyposmocoma kahamanoa]|uniref:uncharacterized protein LOC113231623 isoform X2 n=1 Tax=Hyposmocoma kahamanoa TaxID=1477025 RepID=UPI000E6D6585|nr:uncharacterized protein LOC113231623 isoform X2 [Hyposmocoma kahamanoa]